MKKFILVVFTVALVVSTSFGQTNTFPSTGNVGIGTTTPDNILQVVLPPGNQNRKGISIGRNGGYLLLASGTGVSGKFAPFIKGKSTTDWNSSGLYIKGIPYADNAGFVGVTITGGDETLTSASILTVKNASDEVFRINSAGNVGIGTANPGTYKLAVNGKVKAREIRVTLNGWVDFVFEENYDLPTLSEVEEHIQKNKHLPDIPSAKEVEENGISLEAMNARLLQKIEEITLYLIEQEKRINAITKENRALKSKIERLEKGLEEIKQSNSLNGK